MTGRKSSSRGRKPTIPAKKARSQKTAPPPRDEPAEAGHAPVAQRSPTERAVRELAASTRSPVVALGASAGGLLALEQFFEHVPVDSDMAFVVITHQARDRVTLLPELLAKHSSIPIVIATDRIQLLPNHAYVAPPGQSLLIKDESLHLSPLDLQPGASLAIDRTFRSLAENDGDQAIAIVLSGTGSDGTLGIAAVKAALGMTMAQDPRSAQYPGMPSSAIATQLVDYVLPPHEMPDQLMRYMAGHQRATQRTRKLDDAALDGALIKILAVLRGRTGSDFSAYKKSTIRRRIERRMHVHSLVDPEEYARFLDHTAYEVDALFKELLISVTSFFRDPHAYEVLEHELAKAIELKHEGEPLRAWIAGCATGEEAYSLAILVREGLQRAGKDCKVQIVRHR